MSPRIPFGIILIKELQHKKLTLAGPGQSGGPVLCAAILLLPQSRKPSGEKAHTGYKTYLTHKKMKNLKFTTVALILGIVFLTASNRFTAPEFIAMKNLKFNSFKDNKLNFSLNSVIKNPNPVPLWVDGIDVDVYFDDNMIGNASSVEKIELAANKESEITLNYSVPIDKLKDNLMSLVMKKEVVIKVDGRYTFRNDIKDITVPYTYTTPINFRKEVGGYLLGNL
jgi:LEA14-like dessication related protein